MHLFMLTSKLQENLSRQTHANTHIGNPQMDQAVTYPNENSTPTAKLGPSSLSGKKSTRIDDTANHFYQNHEIF